MHGRDALLLLRIDVIFFTGRVKSVLDIVQLNFSYQAKYDRLKVIQIYLLLKYIPT